MGTQFFHGRKGTLDRKQIYLSADVVLTQPFSEKRKSLWFSYHSEQTVLKGKIIRLPSL